MRHALLALSLALSTALPVLACPYAIRDAGFIIRDPVPYRVLWVTKGAKPETLAAARLRHEQAAARVLDQANVRPESLDLGREPNHPLRKQFEALCAAGCQPFLVSPEDRVTLAPSSLASDPDQAVTETLRQTVESPKRQEIVNHLPTAWCVVLVVEGKDRTQNAAVLKTVGTAAGKLAGFKPEMGDPIEAAPPVVRVAWDDPREAVLRWSLGLDETDPQGAKVAVLFGRGRRVGPVMSATQATESRLLEIFHTLGRNCTCTADPSWLLGPALPLNWGRERQRQVREALGFDPDNPNVAATLSGVWKNFRARDAALVPGENVPEPTTGYMEFDVQQQATPPPPEGADPDAAPQGEEGALLEPRSWRAAAQAGGIVAAAALGGSAVLYLLHRRHA